MRSASSKIDNTVPPSYTPGMKSYRKELWFNTTKRREFLNITDLVNACLKESGVREGLLLVNAMHITCCFAYLLLLHK